MAVAHVQLLGTVETAVAAQTTTVLSPSSKTVTAGNTVVVGFLTYSDTTATQVQDNLGNTYARVERVWNSSTADAMADLWYAPVTSGGSITTITVTHDSAQYRSIIASEFSGMAASPSVGSGTFGTSTTATWASNKTIPADGAIIGISGTGAGVASTPGSNSGSPSTAISESGETSLGTSMAAALDYALGGTGVTSFTGTNTWDSSAPWAGAGGIFSPSVTTPTWTTPADTVGMSLTPDLQFNSPTSAVAQHFQLQLDTANTFNTGNLRTYDSSTSQTNWTFWNGSAWTAFPSTGLATGYSGNEVRYSVTSALSAATWYRRVRAGTGT